MPRGWTTFSNYNYDAESSLNLVPTLSHIYRTSSSSHSRTPTGAFPVIPQIPYHTVPFHYPLFLFRTSYSPNKKKKKKNTANPSFCPFSSLAAFSDLDPLFLSFSIRPRIFPPTVESTQPSSRSCFSVSIDPNFGPIGARCPFLGFRYPNILDLSIPTRDLKKKNHFLFHLGSGPCSPCPVFSDFVNYFSTCIWFWFGPSKSLFGLLDLASRYLIRLES